MKSFSCCLSLVFLSVWVLGASGVPAAKFSLVAVRINGTCVGGADAGEHCTRDIDCDSPGVCGGSIAPTASVSANPGDKIQCEIFASEWTPENQDEPVLSEFSVTFLVEKFQAVPPAQGELIPFRGLRPCVHNDECWGLPEGCVGGFCVSSDDKAGGAFIRVLREDYVFLWPWPQIGGVDFSYNYRFGAALSSPSSGLVYEVPKYCGTLILTVSDDACGVFTVVMEDCDPQQSSSCMRDLWRIPILPLVVEPLTIDAGEDCGGCEVIESTYPPNCALDARQLTKPDGTARKGWSSIEFTFENTEANPCRDTSYMTTDNFSVREYPSGPLPPTISSVTPNGNKITATLNRRITLQKWTCVTYHGPDPPGDQEICFGHLPADVSNDETSAPADILWLIDCLNGVRTCEDYQCDVDRSVMCGPPDILRVIDLLNGAEQYDQWLNESMPIACPTAP